MEAELVGNKRRFGRKSALSIGLLAAVLAGVGTTFAQFTDTVTAGPQTISTGKIVLATGTNDAATGATNIVPGDTVAREIDLNSTNQTVVGADASITLGFTAGTSSLLDSDQTNGLQVSVNSCSVAWTRTAGPPPTYTCGGTTTAVLIGGSATASVKSLETTPAALTPLNSLTLNHTDYLVFTLTFPSTSPGDLSKVVTACSGTVGGSVTTENLEGCSSTLTYNFVATQRAGSVQ